MDAVTIKLKASGQQLSVISSDLFAANTVSYIRAEFELGYNWDGFDSVRAVWASRFATIATVLDGDGACTVPWEVLNRTDTVYVNLVGSISDDGELTDRLTTYKIKALDVNGCTNIDGTETAVITPSQFEQFIEIVKEEVESIKDIDRAELNSDYTLTLYYSDGTSDTVGPIRGEQGETGNGIESAVLNDDYTLTLTFTDGTSYTTPSIRGAQGEQGATGNGIESVYLTGQSGAVKTYTILFTDGSTFDYQVTDGEVTNAVLEQVLPTDSANGSIASFPDGSDLFDYLSCVVNIEPVQAGSGTPSPDNVRPITGWTGCKVAKTGKNLVPSWSQGYWAASDGSESIGGSTWIHTPKIMVVGGVTYTFSCSFETRWFGVCAYDASGAFIGNLADTGNTEAHTVNRTIVMPDDCASVGLSYSGATTSSTISPSDITDFQMEISSAKTTYEPYNPNSAVYPVSWQTEAGTVYGGTVDLVTGVLTVDRARVDLGTLSFTDRATGTNNKFVRATLPSAYRGYPKAEYSASAEKYAVIDGVSGTSVLNNPDSKDVGIYWYSNSGAPTDTDLYIICPVSDIPSGKMVYKLATPTTYQLDPVQVACLLGQNNVWADCGDIEEVKYKADVQKWIEKHLGE